jgi:hypothetical protein
LRCLTCYRSQIVLLCAAVLFNSPWLRAQQNSGVPLSNSSVIFPDGTAHVTRVVPLPATVSPEARRSLSKAWLDDATPEPLDDRRRGTDTWQATAAKSFQDLYPVDVQSS